MEIKNYFVLSDTFKKNAKTYQTQPVMATKYKPGMENAWMIYFSNMNSKKADIPECEGVKFFPTEADARAYVETHDKQYIKRNGELIECEVEYDLLRPVLLRKVVDAENKVGVNFCFGEYTFESNETDDYEYYILEEDSWIILDIDGKIRVWDKDCLDFYGETFFGKDDNLVYQKVSEDKYIKVTV